MSGAQSAIQSSFVPRLTTPSNAPSTLTWRAQDQVHTRLSHSTAAQGPGTLSALAAPVAASGSSSSRGGLSGGHAPSLLLGSTVLLSQIVGNHASSDDNIVGVNLGSVGIVVVGILGLAWVAASVYCCHQAPRIYRGYKDAAEATKEVLAASERIIARAAKLESEKKSD